jgi:hypothetical protein
MPVHPVIIASTAIPAGVAVFVHQSPPPQFQPKSNVKLSLLKESSAAGLQAQMVIVGNTGCPHLKDARPQPGMERNAAGRREAVGSAGNMGDNEFLNPFYG